jgi:hypothetical protein
MQFCFKQVLFWWNMSDIAKTNAGLWMWISGLFVHLWYCWWSQIKPVCFQAAAELEQRKENFSKEMDFVVANVVCLSLSLVFKYVNLTNFFQPTNFKAQGLKCYYIIGSWKYVSVLSRVGHIHVSNTGHALIWNAGVLHDMKLLA